ncbi:MAG: HAMP domain-containing histidine kinase [Phycisphaerales bacterium]|nr:HAMP domain-containing histidine kinase [Phycisphaerales bacterium]
MKLTLKLMAVIVAGIIGLTVLNAYLTVRREVRLFDSDMERDAQVLGRSMRNLIEELWQVSGEERALAIIDGVNGDGHVIKMRWVWLDAQADGKHKPAIPLADLAPVVQGKELSIKKPKAGDAGFRYTYVPVHTGSSRPGALELWESLVELSQYTGSTIRRAVVLSGGIILLGGVTALAFGLLFVGRPLRQLSEKAVRVGTGDFSGPLHLPGRDELSGLASTINTMCDQLVESHKQIISESEARIAALEQLRHADRLKTVGRLASGIAHELGTPLNVVGGRATMIAGGKLTDAEVVENARIIKSQSDRMATIIRQLLDFARARSQQRERIDLRTIASQTVDLLTSLARKRNVNLVNDPAADPIWATIDSGQILQVLTNLVMNATQAMHHAGNVTVSTAYATATPPDQQEPAESEYVCLRVTDEGEGIAPDSIRQVFEPFFTTKDVGEGTGLGLSIAYGIIREHGGWIDVQSEVGKGSCFSVYLPREANACDRESS